jgi:uncharacterized protein YaiL (DUF2058 family)
MSDLREQLLKAGLVSPKQVRQARHEDRVHRKEVGHEGLEAERADREREQARDQEEKRRRDQEREEERRQRQADEERAQALARRIQAGWVREATGGNRRFYFVVEQGRITYLDLTDQAVRRLLSGSAAIACTRGAVRGEYCVIDANAAASLARDHGEVLCFWNRISERRS